MSTDKYVQQIRLTLPLALGGRLEKMALERDMTLNSLVSDLVRLGMTSLNYPEQGRIEPQVMGVDPTSDNGFGRGY